MPAGYRVSMRLFGSHQAGLGLNEVSLRIVALCLRGQQCLIGKRHRCPSSRFCEGRRIEGGFGGAAVT